MRLQLALNVHNLKEAIDFYSKLFNTAPHKIRTGYANFAIESPPLKLVLFENPLAESRLNHLGVEVLDQASLTKSQQRFTEADLLDSTESEVVCCHAAQNKIWVREPQGLKWEWYMITDDNPPLQSDQTACCNGINTFERSACCS